MGELAVQQKLTELIAHIEQSATNEIKTSSKRVIQKTSEAKIADVVAASEAVAKSYNVDDKITSNPNTAPQTVKKS